MPWFKVDDSFHAHPKVLATGADALGLWVVAGAWSSSHLTDGFVPDHALPRLLPGSDDLARKLVAAKLWRRVRGGFEFHDWADFNPSSKEVRAMREKRAEAGRLGGLASGKTRSKDQRRTNEGPTSGLRTDLDGRSSDARETAEPDSKGHVASGKTRSKQASKTEARASRIVEPPARPDPSTSRGRSSASTYDRTRDPPAPRCEEHLDDPDPPNCGQCAGARRAWEAWDLADSNRRRTAEKCRLHRGQPADNCALCRSEELEAQ